MRYNLQACAAVLGALLISACSKPTSNAGRIEQADREPQNWLSYGRTYSEQRFSPLNDITADNVGRLGLAWYADLDTNRGQESTPLVVDGVLYSTSAWSKLQAFDAASGKLLWQFDPHVPGSAGVKACCDVVNRGAAIWGNTLYLGTLDGRLIAVDAKTGQQRWSVVTVDVTRPYTITGAPRVVKGKVIIGNGGAEMGVRGYVSAYDAETGKLLWRFFTVPGDPNGAPDNAVSDATLAKLARSTWTGNWWSLGGGGTVWDSMAYDPELDLLYVGVGNGSPWNQEIRSPGGGDNLFLSSILALRPDTGEYVWHYQTTPGESWDYTATQHLILADLKIDGQPRKVLMQAPKNGFFYVIDRTNGRLISAHNYVPVNWATGIDMKTGRPIENPAARYGKTGQPFVQQPGPLGGHNWHPMAFSPQTGLVYLPAQEMSFPYVPEHDFTPVKKGMNLGVDLVTASLPQDPNIKAAVKASTRGHLAAWDPVSQREVWRVQFASPWNGGVLATAGNLVFQGTTTGELRAYRADTGQQVWSFPVQTGVMAPPVTYRVGNEQYVAVVAGWGGAFPNVTGEISWVSGKTPNRSRVLAFKLGAQHQLPNVPDEQAQATAMAVSTSTPQASAPSAEPADVAAGKRVYLRFCSQCHGDAGVSGGVLPDLRHSAALMSSQTWSSIVSGGALEPRGMVSFADALTPADVETIRAYIASRAREERAN